MSFINIILFSLLILQSTSAEEGLVKDDATKCMKANFLGEVSTEACTEVTPELESTGDYKGQCCKLTYLNDHYQTLKKCLEMIGKLKYVNNLILMKI